MTHIHKIKPWLSNNIEPLSGESLSHFLGRLRRQNPLTPIHLGQIVGIGVVIARWEEFHFIPCPTLEELEVLASMVEVDPYILVQMLPPKGVEMLHEPIRLCGACYGEVPCHRIEWQFKKTKGCDRHQLHLLSKCPNCGKRFNIPALWEEGVCQGCHLEFKEMAKYQRPIVYRCDRF